MSKRERLRLTVWKPAELYEKRAKLLEEAASAERCGALLKELRGIWAMIERVDREILECEEV